ncbi:MAG: TolB family protein [Actinomycetota bacterium]
MVRRRAGVCRAAIAFAGTAAMLWTAAPASAGITDPVPLRATKAEEQIPASSRGYLAWAQSNRALPRVELRRPDGTIVRVNPIGTFGWPGGFDGKRLVLQRSKTGTFNSDLLLYNVKTGRTRGFPATVNTRRWEWGPTLSGDLVMFGRNRNGRDWEVLLFDRRTSELKVLAGPTNRAELLVGQVNGRYAVWTRATDDGWDVILYDLVTGTWTRIPRPDGVFAQYAPSVTADGTAYFATSGNRCGEDVSIQMRPIGGPTTQLFALPPQHDIQRTYVDESGADPQVLYDPGRCLLGFAPFVRLLSHEDIWGFTDLGDGSGRPGSAATAPSAAPSGPGKRIWMPSAGIRG